MARADTSGGKGLAATVAALVALAADVLVPVLPIYGNGRDFAWSDVPSSSLGRFLTVWLVGQLASAVAVLFGIWMLRRHRSAVAAGAFAAVAIVVALGVAAELLPDPSVLSRWQTALAVGLGTLEAAALVVAASMSMRRWA